MLRPGREERRSRWPLPGSQKQTLIDAALRKKNGGVEARRQKAHTMPLAPRAAGRNSKNGSGINVVSRPPPEASTGARPQC